jgi:serine/threonine protein kinase
MYVCAECGQRHDLPGYCPSDGRPLVATDDPLLGTEVGRYRLASLVGEGGMGRVYLGVQPAIGSRVAVKILSDQCARDPALLERFFAEAKAVNLIRHESIVSVLDLARLEDGRPYIVMEFVPGHTLGPLVRAEPAPLGGIVQVITEVLSALEAAHQIGIVHRDLKPDNILVTGEGHAKVLDFGIAKLAPGLSHMSPRTATGALLGTPAYMAPEQISAGTVDPRTDVYAAGIVLYEAVTGRVPFAGETLFDLMKQHLETPPVPPSHWRPGLPSAIERVILTALEKEPARRFPTALAMAEALGQAASELPPDQWRALVRGGVITGGQQSITKLVAGGSGRHSARRPNPSRPPEMGYDPTFAAPSGAHPLPNSTRDLRPRRDSGGPAPWADHDPTKRDSRPPHDGPRAAGSVPPRDASGQFDPTRADPGSVSPYDPRQHRGSLPPPYDPTRPDIPHLDPRRARVGDPRTPHELIPPPVRRRVDPDAPDLTRPEVPAQTKRRWPIVIAVLASAAIATTITLLVVRSNGEPTVTDGGSASEQGTPPDPMGSPAPSPKESGTAGSPTAGSPTTGSAAGSGIKPRNIPPIIVGGGSAADHGVHLGPGVRTGGGVIIGSSQPKGPRPVGVVDYDPRQFDALAYLPKARELARKIYPDAELTEFEFFENVRPDGGVDLTLRSSSGSYYEFRSAANSVFAKDRRPDDELPCYVMVDIAAHSVSARVRYDDECDRPLRAAPRCTFAEVWKLARPKDTTPATVGYLTDGTWWFDHDHAGKRPGASTTTSFKDCR